MNMTDIRQWSREYTLEFIEEYRRNPCLWKIKSSEYSDRVLKAAAYETMVDKLQEVDPSATKDTVVKKIDSLRSCYRKELKKIRESKKSGWDEPYKPRLWYFHQLQFLTNDSATANMADDQSRDEPTRNAKASSSYESNASNSKLDKKRGSLAAKRRKPGCAEVSSCGGGRGLKEPRPAVGGEMFSAFGMHVAEELNNLPYEMATYCQKLINDAIFSAKLGELSKHSHIVTIPVPVPASQLPMEPVSGDKLYANNTYDNSNV